VGGEVRSAARCHAGVLGMKFPLLVAAVVLVCSVRPSGQLVGPCPPVAERQPERINELRGVVVDEILGVAPKVLVKLQVPKGRDFRDIGATETDSNGRFSFAVRHRGTYRLVFSGRVGLCRATIPVTYSKTGLKGIRLTLPTAATDTCPQYCESRLKVEEMTGREGHE